MSNSTESRWRTSNAAQQQSSRRNRNSIQGPPQSPAQRASNNNADATTKNPNPAAAASPSTTQPNAWTSATASERARSASAARATNPHIATAASGSAATASSTTAAGSTDSYIPAGGFNKEEVKEFLRKRHQEALAEDKEQVSRWKPPNDSGSTAKQGGPWGAKPTMMANGSDFWVQLKKQIAAKEQGG